MAGGGPHTYFPCMDTLFNILIPICLIAVVVPLVLGGVALVRGGEYNRRNANRFMRWRVMMQAVAIGVLCLAFWYKGTH